MEDVEDVEESDDDDDLISPSHKRQRLSDGPIMAAPRFTPVRRSTRLHSILSSSFTPLKDNADATPTNSSPLTRRSTRLQQAQTSPSARLTRSPSVQTLVSVEVTTPSRQSSAKLSELGSAETSDEDDILLASRPTVRRRQSRATKDPFCRQR